ncbi:glycosyltransferase family 2 protein [Halomonas sp. HK25]|uniref:glycosyltransferase family 2 protein n=1 Tax=Halomonas sp. HK25 TaxID=3394321 RepID=UPI0039FBD218
MGSPTISVIIPAYNVAQYIGSALESLNNQYSLPDEVIIIDDGSTDGTLAVIKAFDHAYTVKILATENHGQGAARNLGVSLARGDYIYFFDADDLLRPDCIRNIKAIISEQGMPDIIFFSGECLYETEWLDEKELGYSRGFRGGFSSLTDLLEAFDAQGATSASPCLYASKRALWVGYRLHFIDYYHEDEQIFFPLIFSAETYYVTDAVYFIRRVRHNSTMTQRKSERHAMGLHSTVLPLLDMKKSISDKYVGKFVSKRALCFIKRYICSCRIAGIDCDKSMILSASLILRSPRVLMYFFYFSSGGRFRGAVKRFVRAGASAGTSS